MRCKKHYTDLSSAVGVCAPCLRERLLSLIAAQEQLQNPGNIPRLVFPHFNSRTSDHSAGVSKKKRSFIQFIPFTNIFRSRNRKPVVPRAPDSTFTKSRGSDNATSSSWFSSVISGSRHRRKQADVIGPVRLRDRGISPVRNADVISVDENESWKNTPRRTPAVRRGGSVGHVSGLAFCLSPLVRASPNLQWNRKGLPPEVVFSGEIGGQVKPHLSSTKSFCANRSRKLADFGRTNLNR